jgi:hypothetical protein
MIEKARMAWAREMRSRTASRVGQAFAVSGSSHAAAADARARAAMPGEMVRWLEIVTGVSGEPMPAAGAVPGYKTVAAHYEKG